MKMGEIINYSFTFIFVIFVYTFVNLDEHLECEHEAVDKLFADVTRV